MRNTSHIFIFWISCFLLSVFVLFSLLDTRSSSGQNSGASLFGGMQTESGTLVTRVVDGDTLEVQVGKIREKVRLIGVNAPESVDPRRTVECFGKEASAEMKKLTEGKRVSLVSDPTQSDIDSYGRLLRYVYVKDEFINLEMIKKGYAYEFTYAVPYLHQSEFRNVQRIAIQKGEGLWASSTCAGKK